MAMKEYLFLYGTLLPEYAPDEIAREVRQLHHVGCASVRGRLYDLGQYPGAILDASTGMKIYGQLFVLPTDQRILHALDTYEGFEPSNTKSSLFIRQNATVALSDGRTVQCWVYVYNRDPGTAPLVSGGDYAKFQAA